MKTDTDASKQNWFRKLIRYWFPPAPVGECTICDEPTTEFNLFEPSWFYHKSCMAQLNKRLAAEKEQQELLDLVKRAIREVKAEQ